MSPPAGRTLADLLKEAAPLPPAAAVRLLGALCDALPAGEGPVYPGGIEMAGGDRVTGVRRAEPGQAEGAPYLAPEVRQRSFTAAAEVYGLGALLYEMLAGRPPFAAEHAVAIMTATLNNPLPDLYQFRPAAPPALVALIKQMLVKERELRLDSMRQVAAGLEVIRRDAV